MMSKMASLLHIFVLIILTATAESIPKGRVEFNHVANGSICDSKPCLRFAKNLKSASNLNADPCSDFYQFACGGPGRTLDSIAHEEAWNNRNALLGLARKERSSSPAMRELHTYHESCVNRKSQNLSTIHKLLDELGDRAFLEPKIHKPAAKLTEVLNLALSVQLKGFSHPFFQATTNFYGTDTSKIFIELLPRKFSDKRNFANLLINMKLDANVTQKDLDAVEKIQQKLVSMEKSVDWQKRELINLAELKGLAPEMNWWDYLRIYYNTCSTVWPDEDEPIIVTDRNYFISLSEFLSSQEPEHLAGFVIMQMLDEAATYSGGRLESVASKQLPRLCLDAVADQLGYLFSYQFGRHFVSDQRQSAVTRMVKNIRDEFNTMIGAFDWLEEKTKRRALAKLAAIEALVAWPREFSNWEPFLYIISGVYSDNFTSDSYLDNVLMWRRGEQSVDVNQLHGNFRRLAWIKFRDSTSVNAFYEDAFNSINILAGYLNDALFDETVPMYLNYALVGSTIGHELVHAFDRNGIKLDERGDMSIWWDADSRVGYERRLECVVRRYSSLTIPGSSLRLNGSRTLDENMADLIGVKLAYGAYKRSFVGREDSGDDLEPRLRGLEQFNGRQLFWLGYGARWCNKLTPAQIIDRASKDPHSPDSFRVNVPLQMMGQFANDFQCPRGSGMNPVASDDDCDDLF